MIKAMRILANFIGDEEHTALETQVSILGVYKQMHSEGYDVIGAQTRYCMCGNCDNACDFLFEALSCIFGSVEIESMGYLEDNGDEFPERNEDIDMPEIFKVTIEDPLAVPSDLEGLPIEESTFAGEPVIAKHKITEKGWEFWIFDDFSAILFLIPDFFVPLHKRKLEIVKGDAA